MRKGLFMSCKLELIQREIQVTHTRWDTGHQLGVQTCDAFRFGDHTDPVTIRWSVVGSRVGWTMVMPFTLAFVLRGIGLVGEAQGAFFADQALLGEEVRSELIFAGETYCPKTGFVFGLAKLVSRMTSLVLCFFQCKLGRLELLQVRLELYLVTRLDRERLDLGWWIHRDRGRLFSFGGLVRHDTRMRVYGRGTRRGSV